MHKIVNGEVIELSPQEEADFLAQQEAEKPIILEAKKAEVRNQRNSLLSLSDWTQLPDTNVDKSAWSVYRQSLRDITSQGGFPENIVWPVPPS
jgi:hypothetical protein